ncbi:MAG: hypothetical protein V5804_01220, partial [Mucilaginibacter sp.]|uniref:hypothetical protein n=1 Tax=Mucilaginibacter sp. TaxID=1882438 RepID=UPI0034E61241
TSEDCSFNNLFLTQNNFKISQIFYNSDFIMLEGKKAYDKLMKYPCAVAIVEVADFSKSGSLKETITILDSDKFSIINCMWFVKDNSINAEKCYLQRNQEVVSYFRSSSVTNSEGDKVVVDYSKSELDLIQILVPKIAKLFFYKIEQDLVYEDKEFTTTGANFIAKFKNRLVRAYLFLMVARTTSEVTLKISFYMTLLESLFTSNNNEVQHQLSERSSLFIGGEKHEKKEIFELVKDAYTLRSNLMHGNFIKKTDAEVKRISKNIDEVIRKIFNKILAGESSVFLLSDSDGDKKSLKNILGI